MSYYVHYDAFDRMNSKFKELSFDEKEEVIFLVKFRLKPCFETSPTLDALVPFNVKMLRSKNNVTKCFVNSTLVTTKKTDKLTKHFSEFLIVTEDILKQEIDRFLSRPLKITIGEFKEIIKELKTNIKQLSESIHNVKCESSDYYR